MSEPIPLLRATVGAPVIARGGAKISKVKEIRRGEFKVRTGLIQSDFWLTGDAIESAVPDEAVTLAVPKNDLDPYKVDEPKAA